MVAATAQAGGGGAGASQGNPPANPGNSGNNQGNPPADPGNQGNQGNQPQASNTPGPSPTRGTGASDKRIEKRVVGSTTDGRGGSAAPVQRGQAVTFEIVVFGMPPGQRTGTVSDELTDNAPPKLTYNGGSATVNGQPARATFDGNKLTVEDVPFSDTGSVTVRAGFTALADAPCNSVVTNVAHVNGIGSDQAQVRITCPDGAGTPTATATATAAAGITGATNTPTPTATATAVGTLAGSVTIEKNAQDEDGAAIGPSNPISRKHLGKTVTYNILVTRNGGTPGRTEQFLLRDEFTSACPGVVQSVESAQIDPTGTSATVGDVVYESDSCTVTVRGDAKFDVGNRLHLIVKVRLVENITSTAPGAPSTRTLPATLDNRATITLTGGSLTGGSQASTELRLPISLPPGGTAAQGPRPASAVNLPAAVEARLAGSLEVAGVTLQPGEAVRIIALPPGAVVQSPPGGGAAVVPPGSVLGITSQPQLGQVTVQTPVFVEVLDQVAVRAPAQGALPQAGTGPSLSALPSTGTPPSAPALAIIATVAAATGAALRRLRRG